MRHRYPIVLDVTERLAVIVGGGKVASRKAAALVEAGARQVRVVAPQFTSDFPAGVQRLTEAYAPLHLEGAQLVFAATDSPQVNDAVIRDARARGILANRADPQDDEPGDFLTPARMTDDAVIVAINAGSAALSAYLRDRVAERWEKGWSEMAQLMRLLRREIHASGIEPAERREVFRELASDEAIEVLRQDGEAGLRQWLSRKHPRLREVPGRS